MNELISVIVPIYNKQHVIHQCIDSLLNQTYSNIEILLVNDASFDHSGKICEEYAKKDNRIVYFCHETNTGSSGARNTALDHARGKYISFVDGDDYVQPNFLEILYKNLKEYHADISVCDFIKIDPSKGEALKDSEEEIVIQEFSHPMDMLSTLQWARAVVVWNKLYDARLFEGIRFPLNRIHQDEFTIHHVVAKANKVVFTSEKPYIYLQHEDSVMHNQTGSTYYDGYLSIKDRITLLNDRNDIKNRNFWLLRLIELTISYYNRSDDKEDGRMWKLIFKQRILSLLEEYPESFQLMNDNLKKKVEKVIYS